MPAMGSQSLQESIAPRGRAQSLHREAPVLTSLTPRDAEKLELKAVARLHSDSAPFHQHQDRNLALYCLTLSTVKEEEGEGGGEMLTNADSCVSAGTAAIAP